MLFEIRNTIPTVSDSWTQTRDLFLNGQSRKAWDAASARRGEAALQTANDYVLNIEIARSVSAYKPYLALVRLARRAFPDDPIVQLYYARVEMTRGRHISAIDYLMECRDTLGAAHPTLWAMEIANIYGNAGFEDSCREWMQTASADNGQNSPLALYTQSCAFEGMRQWNKAIDYARQCVDAAPDWSRARAYLAHCLLTQGQLNEAQQQLREAKERGHEEHLVDFTSGMLSFAMGHFDEAQTLLKDLLDHWPQADMQEWVRRTLCILLCQIGRLEEARELVDGQNELLKLPELPETLSGAQCFLPLPLISQNKNQCVPTTVAMAAYPQGGRFNPDQLFREMHGRDGTPLWRMREWVRNHGYTLIPIRLDLQAIVAMLEQNIPLIGTLEGLFNSHVDVICGYSQDLEVLYVRDPSHWVPAAWPYDLALDRYELHQCVMAVIENSNHSAIQLAESYLSSDGLALLDLNEAVATGNLSNSEKAAGRITDESPAAFLRDMYGCNVTLSPVTYSENMQRIAENESANKLARFRSLMTMGYEAVQPILDEFINESENPRFAGFARRYLNLVHAMGEGRWETADAELDRLMLTGCGVSHFWDLRGDIHAELGDTEQSQFALERAIELEPLQMSLREKQLNRNATQLTLHEYLDEFNRLLNEDPSDKRLLRGRTMALQEGPDGKAFEAAAREYIKWFPRAPGAYITLMSWYQGQDREDLYSAVLDQARHMIPEVFDEPQEDTGEAPDDAGQPKLAEPSSSDMLQILWQPAHADRRATLEKVLQLENEGHFQWYERAQIAAVRLLIPEPSWNGDEPDVASVLPDPPPGVPQWFAQEFLDQLMAYDPSALVAEAVIRWLDRIVPSYRNYPELWFNRVLLLERQRHMEAAIEELKEVLKSYPAYSAALYRMGVVEYRQNDYPSARDWFEKALSVNPGLYGAIQMLREVHELLNEDTAMLKQIRALRRKIPYSFNTLRDEAIAIAQHRSFDDAMACIDASAREFCPRRVAVLKARICTASGHPNTAYWLSEANVADDESDVLLFEEYLQTALNLAQQMQDHRRARELCELGLARWPESAALKEIKAEQLVESDPATAQNLLQEVLQSEDASQNAAWVYLTTCTASPSSAAQSLIESVDTEKQQDLAELFGSVMEHSSLLQWAEPFLEWAVGTYPDSHQLRWRLILHYSMCGQAGEAVVMAEQLLEQLPNSITAEHTLGRCLIDTNPKRALEVLESVCSKDRSADHLFDLARCHSILGLNSQATDLHWEVLEQNPFVCASWTNLMLVDQPYKRLWQYVHPMLQGGHGVQDEYFLVAVVMMAVTLKKQVPHDWFPLATRRFRILQTFAGFRDEKDRLEKCLLAWLSLHPADRNGHDGLPSGFFASLAARFKWPGRSWIPDSR
jgi:tetratricopeptide (TPR) repeat protein